MNREIYLIDLMIYVVSKWRSLLVGGLIGALLATALNFAAIQQEQEMQVQLQREMEEQELEAAHALESLSEDEQERARIKRVQLDGYYDALFAYRNYAEDSLRMHLNPNEFYTATVDYLIASEESGYAYYVANAYKDSLISVEMLQTVANRMMEDKTPQYYGSAFQTEVINQAGENEATSKNESVVVKVTFQHNKKECCEKVIEIIENRLQECGAQIESLYAFEGKKLSSSVVVCNDSSLIGGQKGTIENMSAVYNAIVNIKNGMTEKEQKYYEKTSKYAFADKEDAQEEIVVEEHSPNLMIYAVAGIIAGIAVAAIVHCIYYVLIAKIRSKHDFENCTGTVCFSMDDTSNNQKNTIFAKIDGGIRKLRFRDEVFDNECEMLIAMLKSYAEKNEIGTIYVTGSRINKITLPRGFDKLSSRLKELGISVSVGKNALIDAEEFEKCRGCDAVLLVEKCDSTDYRKVSEIMTRINYCGIKVAGSVLIH